MKHASVVLPSVLFAICLCGCSSTRTGSVSDADDRLTVDTPFTKFSQDLQTAVKTIDITAGGTTHVPVVFHNTGAVTWASSGKYPVTISYKWFDSGQMLPMEGERTLLPHPVRPGESVSIQVKVVAPPSGKDLVVKISLVQEAVSWFMMAGAKALELPATLR
jgi:hypothetical protein